ncbi:DNA adenine methylase, partial [Capnocytophaga canimorsus]|uniref:DNA adenine methylase n=1 Tax=Capnocytophaga canimorsus TaxID=28188 RepID=UPI00385D2BAE
EGYSERLKYVQIENNDASAVIASHDTEYTFIYCDPPYVGANQGHYGGYTQEYFNELLSSLSKIKGKFLLSSYQNEYLLKYVNEFGWHQKEISLHLGTSKTAGKKRIEVLTANYEI